ncbi:hypothetical protein CA850_13490 [Micromonospora echinospora]|uniref:Peptidase inhibitor family I36 n=1 Tax=Micromonospora echinospora TaxID=1877 RepID=A0A1C4YI83_MICEC|nr:hypothetical protein [Micromonospora echinospora]OZV81141.1 hypothetical protein CA850_13490 [Micromonospora echinospora]SCF20041.1 hypothetical protein GA0070618_3982 [Micromonospora echinospora]
MPPNHVLPTFRHRHRRRSSTLVLLFGLLLGLAAPAAVTTPASAGPVIQRDSNCWSSGWSVPPGVTNPVALTYSWIGSRSNGGYTYRYWIVEEPGPYYRSSYVAKCSGDLLVSTSSLTPTSGFGTPFCTSAGDIYPPQAAYADRYVGQRIAWQRPYLGKITFRFWHREWLGLSWYYDSSSVVQC